MKLFDSKIKKFLTFLEMEPCTFSAQARKKKIYPERCFRTSGNENFEKISHIFSKESFSYIS